MATRTGEKDTGEALHDIGFPGESPEYRRARNRLLEAEAELRRATEAVAASRRRLPPGGPVPEDYVFEGAAEDGGTREARLSGLFAPGKDTLALYSFMYGPEDEEGCPLCTSILDSLDGNAPHLTQRLSLAVVAKSPLPRILAHAEARGWRHLRLLSSAGNAYNRDYLGETADGFQLPMLNVFTTDGGEVRHFWGSELLFAAAESGHHPRHIDAIWPIWSLFDFTPEGRGTDWLPELSYDGDDGVSG
jgi:predicted dithiol-disulfide oxidoreductase (DUF899 family)